MSPAQAVMLAEKLGVNPVTAVMDHYLSQEGDAVRLSQILRLEVKFVHFINHEVIYFHREIAQQPSSSEV